MTMVEAVFIAACVTYLLRAIPLLFVRGEITNQWAQAFFYYTPYAVLTAITIPAIFFSTTVWWSAFAGLVVALGLALKGQGLLTVSLSAAVTVWVLEALAGIG